MAEDGERRQHREWLENAAHRALNLFANWIDQQKVLGREDKTVHVYLHFPDPLKVQLTDEPPPAAAITLTIKGTGMPGQITVDTDNETATVGFVDDKGDTDAAQPAGSTFTFSSDNEAVATVSADANNPLVGDITPVSEGTANISVTSNGTAMEADGSTPMPDPAPVQVTVSAGAAAGESLVLSV